MPRKKGGHSPVTLQFAIRYQLPRNAKFRMTKEVINEAIQWWIVEGEAPEGFEIRPIAWIHADKVTEADDEEAFRNILGRFLRAGTPIHFEIRSAERVE